MMHFKAVTDNLLTVVGLLVEPITVTENQRVILRHIFLIGDLPLRLPLVIWLYLPPSIASPFLEVF